MHFEKSGFMTFLQRPTFWDFLDTRLLNFRYPNLFSANLDDFFWGKILATVRHELLLGYEVCQMEGKLIGVSELTLEKSYQFGLLRIRPLHLLKRDDLAAYLEVNKCLNKSPLFQTIFALSFKHYID